MLAYSHELSLAHTTHSVNIDLYNTLTRALDPNFAAFHRG